MTHTTLNPKIIGINILVVREYAGITQRELAERIGVHRSTITKYEDGVNLPRLDIFRDICKVLDVDYAEILDL